MLLDSSKDKAVTMKCTVLSALKILDVKTTYGLAVAAAFRCTSNALNSGSKVSTKNKISKPCIYSTGNVLSATFSIISLCLNIIVSAANILILN